jgi:MFS family permease
MAFVVAQRRFLAFGLLMAFFSNFGQTFFIALFGDHLRSEFDLSHSRFGLLYSGATLASGFALMWAGRLIDRVDLRIFASAVCAGMIAACAVMAAAPAAAVLGLALFMLRFFGQGLLGHTSLTSMARYFDLDRGKAISIAALGFPLGEAVLPIAAVAMLALIGWRATWGTIAIALLLAMIPLTLWLLRGHGRRHEALMAKLARAREHVGAASAVNAALPRREWTLAEVLRDLRFYLLLPLVLAPPMIVTGMFFHQAHLVTEKGWTMAWYASCFVGFAATQLPTSLLSGPLVDRVGATGLLPLLPLPLAAGLAFIALGEHPLVALAFLSIIGITSGAIGTVVNASWAELYGVTHLGSIRTVSGSLMVFSTALAPAGFGLLLDRGVSMEAIAAGAIAYALLASALAWAALRAISPGAPPRVS